MCVCVLVGGGNTRGLGRRDGGLGLVVIWTWCRWLFQQENIRSGGEGFRSREWVFMDYVRWRGCLWIPFEGDGRFGAEDDTQRVIFI